ncbi:MAG: PAS domain-containing protein [Spirochaetia bacterium]|nr:PAS domain-containing protein [Spirochaetia bacterium]
MEKKINYIFNRRQSCALVGVVAAGFISIMYITISYTENQNNQLFMGSISSATGLYTGLFGVTGSIFFGSPRRILSKLQKKENNSQTTHFMDSKINNFEAFFDLSADLLLIFDKKGHIVEVNSACTTLGYTKEEMIGKHITKFAPPDALKSSAQNIARLYEDGKILFESCILSKDGKIIPFEIKAKLIQHNGEQMVISSHRDITLRRQIENMLSRRESKYRAAIETSLDGFWMTDLKGNFLEVNDAYLQKSGYSREEFLAMNISDLEDPGKKMDGINLGKIMHTGKDRIESTQKRKDGSLWSAEVSINHQNIEDGRVFFFIHDISKRKKMLEELEQSKKNLEQILDIAPIGMGIARMDGSLIYVNDALCNLLGYSKEEFKKLKIKDITPPEDHKIRTENFNRMATGEAPIIVEKRYLTKDGKIIWVRGSGMLFNDISGDICHIIQMQNIHDQKIADDKLKASEKKFRVLFDSANDSFFILNLNGNFVDINKAGYEHLGYLQDELIGKHITEIVAPDLKFDMKGKINKIISEGHAKFDSATVHKNGSVIIVEINGKLIEQDGKYNLFFLNRNITLRKHMEDKLRTSEALSRAVIERILDS